MMHKTKGPKRCAPGRRFSDCLTWPQVAVKSPRLRLFQRFNQYAIDAGKLAMPALRGHALGRCIPSTARRAYALGDVLHERHEALTLEWKRDIGEHGAL